jgi:hypothetical protein
MAERRVRAGSSVGDFELALCCPEAQADGVPCPVLGRSCETCARAIHFEVGDVPPPPIRPVGCD